jgi:hypothetical protein
MSFLFERVTYDPITKDHGILIEKHALTSGLLICDSKTDRSRIISTFVSV